MARQWPVILVCSLLIGISHLFVHISTQFVVTGLAAGSEREQNVGRFTFVNSLAFFIGPALGGCLQEWRGMSFSFQNATFIAVASILVSFALPNVVSREKSDTCKGTWELLHNRDIIKAVAVSGIVLFSLEVFMTYFPLYGKEIGLSSMSIGLIFSTYSLASMIIRPCMTWLIRCFTRRVVLLCCLAGGGVSLASFGITDNYLVIGYWLVSLPFPD